MSEERPNRLTQFSPVRVQNPGTHQSYEDVKAQFVIRDHELSIVLDVLRSNLTAPAAQHLLLIAPRGRGKTMLLVRTEAELKTNAEFSPHLLPVRLMQESYEIFDLGSFWLEVLFHLARAVGEISPPMASELEATHKALAGQSSSQPLHEAARAAVLDAADRLDRRLVLMIENLQSLFGGADQDLGWKLRETLQSEPQIILAASATTWFEEMHEADQPFFELFRTLHLNPLSPGECARLWQATSGESVGEQEIRPLQILTGGNPRLLVISAGFAQHRSIRQLMEELVTLVDENTEYFRAHLEILPRSERRVFVSLLDLWRPSSPGEIATRARMDIRAVSTMLARLIDRGAVSSSQVGSSRRKVYSATEPLFSIYYKLRRERDEAAIVENLIVFMLAFYQTDRLRQALQDILPEAQFMASIVQGMDRALERVYETGASTTQKAKLLKDASRTAKQERELQALPILNEIVSAMEQRDYRKAIEIVKANENSVLEELDWIQGIVAEAHLQLGEFDQAQAAAEDYIQRFGPATDPQSEKELARVQLYLAKAEGRRGNFKRSFDILDDIVGRYAESDSMHLQRTVAEARIERLGSRNRAQAPLAELNAVIKAVAGSQQPSDKRLKAAALLLRGQTLGVQGAGQPELESYREAIRCTEGSEDNGHKSIRVIALLHQGLYEADTGDESAMSQTHQQLRAELERCSSQLRPLAEWFEECLRCISLAQEKNPRALDVLASIGAKHISKAQDWTHTVIRVVANLLRAGFKAGDIASTLQSNPEHAHKLIPLIVGLRMFEGELVNEPAEIIEIARDVQTRLTDIRK